MKVNKKIIIPSFLYLLVLGGIVIFPFTQYIFLSLKVHEHKEHLEKISFITDTIIVGKKWYQTLASKKEVSIHGNKYDILQVIDKNDSSLVLLAFKDNYEDFLLEEIVDLFKSHRENKKDVLRQMVMPDWNFEDCTISLCSNYLTTTAFFYYLLRDDIGNCTIVTPPPSC